MVALPWTTAVGLGAEATMSRPRVVIASLWRNDVERNIGARCDHLLYKTSDRFDVSWLWITGDNDDETTRVLGQSVDGEPVTIIDANTGIVGEDVATRRQRLSATATEMFSHVDADMFVLHESDLISPLYVVDALAEALSLLDGDDIARCGMTSGRHVVAGWPVIELNGRDQFYDIWAFRDMRGRTFDAASAMNTGARDELIEVTSLGSIWMAHANLVRDRTITHEAIVELCGQWQREHIRLWADPTIEVRQPVELWTPC